VLLSLKKCVYRRVLIWGVALELWEPMSPGLVLKRGQYCYLVLNIGHNTTVTSSEPVLHGGNSDFSPAYGAIVLFTNFFGFRFRFSIYYILFKCSFLDLSSS
jgi:hypothetical protein